MTRPLLPLPLAAAPSVALAAGPTLALCAPGELGVDAAARTITGLAVPYGPVGQTSAGRLQFAAGSLSWTDVRRVKLLREHDQRDVVGFAVELTDTPAGLRATFHVPEGDNGDRALAEAASGLRDAFSVGVQLDDKSATALRRANGAAVQGSGALRETSLVAVPAFDDARLGAATNAELVVSSWSTNNTPGEPVRCSTCHHIHAAGITACQAEHMEAATAALATAAAAPPAPPAPPATPPQVDPPAAPGPLVTAGHATVIGAPSTYTFSPDSASLVRDAWAARMHGDGQAAERLHRFNAELIDGNAASTLALAAVLRTTDVDVLAPQGAFSTDRRLPLREAIDRGRPLMSRLAPIPIRDASPFLLPVEGEFTGVADHVEGTAHVAEGTLTLGDATMSPKAVSGAYRLSREVVDSTNPAIDRIALRAMLRDYRRQTEAKAYAAIIAATGVAVAVGGPVGLDLALLGFGNDDSDEPTFVAASKGAIVNLAGYLDADGRQLLPAVNPSNSPGTRSAGSTGYSIGGAPLVKATTITGTDVLAIDAEGILAAESPVQTFRFDEVEGPGVIKLALFAYVGVAVLDTTAVERYSVAVYVKPV